MAEKFVQGWQTYSFIAFAFSLLVIVYFLQHKSIGFGFSIK
jgi:hypothetical protein